MAVLTFIYCFHDIQVSFKYVKTFNMDEYVGIPEDHPESYHRLDLVLTKQSREVGTFLWNIVNPDTLNLDIQCGHF